MMITCWSHVWHFQLNENHFVKSSKGVYTYISPLSSHNQYQDPRSWNSDPSLITKHPKKTTCNTCFYNLIYHVLCRFSESNYIRKKLQKNKNNITNQRWQSIFENIVEKVVLNKSNINLDSKDKCGENNNFVLHVQKGSSSIRVTGPTLPERLRQIPLNYFLINFSNTFKIFF